MVQRVKSWTPGRTLKAPWPNPVFLGFLFGLGLLIPGRKWGINPKMELSVPVRGRDITLGVSWESLKPKKDFKLRLEVKFFRKFIVQFIFHLLMMISPHPSTPTMEVDICCLHSKLASLSSTDSTFFSSFSQISRHLSCQHSAWIGYPALSKFKISSIKSWFWNIPVLCCLRT